MFLSHISVSLSLSSSLSKINKHPLMRIKKKKKEKSTDNIP